MKTEHVEFIKQLFPFKGIEADEIIKVFSSLKHHIAKFMKNDVIYSPTCHDNMIGFMISGECTVFRSFCKGSGIPLNTLKKYSSIGIMAILNPEADYPTTVVASKPSQILFIDGKDMIDLIKKNSRVAMNVIEFLAKKVSFLNKKIATFSERTTLLKVAAYLKNEFDKAGPSIVISRTKMASEIGVGRASLYRDLETLESSGIIRSESKKIILICPEGLERIKK